MWEDLLTLDCQLEGLLRRGWQATRDSAARLYSQRIPHIQSARWAAEALLVLPLWFFFEAYRKVWSLYESVLQYRLSLLPIQLQRFLFCWVLSCVIGHVLILSLTPLPFGLWTIGLCSVHAYIMHAGWNGGPRWCRQKLGVRPSRIVDREEPYGGLDLGN